jgi:hypothetical protein
MIECALYQVLYINVIKYILNIDYTVSIFPVGRNRSTQRKPTTFGRALTEFFHINISLWYSQGLINKLARLIGREF